MNFNLTEEFDRQLNLYDSLKFPVTPSIIQTRDALDTCISGCKKLESDFNLKKLLYKVYRGII